MPTGKFATVFVFLMVVGSTARLFPAPLNEPGTAAPASSSESLADASRLLRLFNDNDDDEDAKPTAAGTLHPPQAEGRYAFGLLDHRSSYGKDFFPDQFLGPEFDQETQVEADYLHGERGGQRDDEGDVEVEWNLIGQLTVAGEFGYDSEHQPQIPNGGTRGRDDKSDNARGFEDVNLAAYHPIFQAVSKDDRLDYSAAIRLDAGIPTHTAVSGGDVQLTPYLGQLLRVGDHVSVQAWTGIQFNIGPDRMDGLIYGASFGYEISRRQMSLPFTRSVTPLFELDGRTFFSSHGQEALFGVVGFDWQFTGKGDLQPRIGIGYEFPIDQGARDQLHGGITAQVFLEL